MGRRPIGTRPMTALERLHRHRAKQQAYRFSHPPPDRGETKSSPPPDQAETKSTAQAETKSTADDFDALVRETIAELDLPPGSEPQVVEHLSELLPLIDEMLHRLSDGEPEARKLITDNVVWIALGAALSGTDRRLLRHVIDRFPWVWNVVLRKMAASDAPPDDDDNEPS